MLRSEGVLWGLILLCVGCWKPLNALRNSASNPWIKPLECFHWWTISADLGRNFFLAWSLQ
jgi:hypothetical protein